MDAPLGTPTAGVDYVRSCPSGGSSILICSLSAPEPPFPNSETALARLDKEAQHARARKAVTPLLMTPDAVPLFEEYADCLQIGARNMQNFNLLQACGRAKKPVLLKRGLSATLEELQMAAEYILSSGNRNVILCERGVRTFERATRNTLDLSAVAVLKEWSHLPVIVDPSHGTGQRSLVPPMARAAIACGADGLILEVHAHPERALSDGPQSLTPAMLAETLAGVTAVARAVGRA